MSGIKFDQGKAPMGLLPFAALTEVAKVMQHGANKYGKYNYLKGMDWSRLYDANLRHLADFIEGKNDDAESGLSHLAHAACCSLFLLEYVLKEIGNDDRYNEEDTGAELVEKKLKESARKKVDELNILIGKVFAESSFENSWGTSPVTELVLFIDKNMTFIAEELNGAERNTD